MIKRLALLFTLLLSASLLKAATYYVTQSGAGSGDGSSAANAWSLASFNGSSKPTGGDTVNFTGTFTGTVSPASNGTGNGTSRLRLDLTKATLNSANPRVRIVGKAFLTVVGGTLGDGSNGNLIDFGSSTGGVSHDITIDSWTFNGTNVSAGVNTFLLLNYCYNLTVSNCTWTNGAMFISGDSTLNHDILITGCDATSSKNTSAQTDVLHVGDAADFTIEKCRLINRAPGDPSVRHNDVIQNYQKGGSNPGNPTNWVIRYNWIEMQQTTGSGDASWIMFQSMNGDPALKIYSNVFVGNTTTGNNGIMVSRNTGGKYYLYNNTIIRHNKPDNTVRYLDAGTMYMRNNVGMADAGVGGTFVSITMTQGGSDYNFWYRFGTTGAGPNGSTSKDPLFTNYAGNDFSLQPASPLRGAGDSTIGAEYNTGIAPGAQWPNPTLASRAASWDVGAYVGTAGPAPSPTPSPTPTPVPDNKFKVGDYVVPIQLVNVRQTPAGTVLGTHDVGDVGQVMAGPTVADLNGAPVNWYDIDWTTNPTDGWVGDDNLELTAKPNPTPTPAPTPTPIPTPTPGPSPTPTPGAPTYEKWIENQNNWIRANPPKPD